MQEQECLSTRCGGARRHLLPPAARGERHQRGTGLPRGIGRPVHAAAVDDDDLPADRLGQKCKQEIGQLRGLIQHRDHHRDQA
jgi:hypothetical protein